MWLDDVMVIALSQRTIYRSTALCAGGSIERLAGQRAGPLLALVMQAMANAGRGAPLNGAWAPPNTHHQLRISVARNERDSIGWKCTSSRGAASFASCEA